MFNSKQVIEKSSARTSVHACQVFSSKKLRKPPCRFPALFFSKGIWTASSLRHDRYVPSHQPRRPCPPVLRQTKDLKISKATKLSDLSFGPSAAVNGALGRWDRGEEVRPDSNTSGERLGREIGFGKGAK
jgi:hypothetical protein